MKLLQEIRPNMFDNQPFSFVKRTLLTGSICLAWLSLAHAKNFVSDSVSISGKVLNAATKAPVKAKIYYRDIPNGNIIGFLETDATSGEYSIVLYERNQYALEIQAIGYAAGYVVANATDEALADVTQDINLAPVAPKQVIDLRSLSFSEENEILIKSYEDLDRLVGMLQINPTLTVSIGNGTKASLVKEKRDMELKSIRHFLVKRGIMRNRIKLLSDAIKPTSIIEQPIEITVINPK